MSFTVKQHRVGIYGQVGDFLKVLERLIRENDIPETAWIVDASAEISEEYAYTAAERAVGYTSVNLTIEWPA